MPSLMTPIKKFPEQEPSRVVSEDKVIRNEEEVEDEEQAERDNEEDISALMVASSTISNKKLTTTDKRKARIRRDFRSQIAMLSPDDVQVTQDKAQSGYKRTFESFQGK